MMSSKHVSMTLGEVQDTLRNLRRVKQFYSKQITSINSSIRQHDKIAKQLQCEKYDDHVRDVRDVHTTITDEEDATAEYDEESEYVPEYENGSPLKKVNEKRKKNTLENNNMQDDDISSDSVVREHKKLKRNNRIRIKVKEKKVQTRK